MDLPESTPHEMPLKDGSVSKSSIILAVVAFGESGFFPPLIFFLAVVHLLCSFFAPLTIPLHLSFTFMADLLENPSALTLSVITSHTRLSCLLESVVEILLLTVLIFSSASSKITVHSAGVKFGFLARFAGEEAKFCAMSRH